MNKPRIKALPALSLMAAGLFFACEKTAPPPEHNHGPVTVADKSNNTALQPLEIAQKLCTYTQGGLPSWILLAEFRDFLTPAEESAIYKVAQEITQSTPEHMRNKRTALARFTQKNTQCHFESLQNGNDGELVFSFTQTIPVLTPTPPPQQNSIDAWLRALSEAYNGQTTTGSCAIVLRPEAGAWKLVSDVEESIARPLAELRSQQAYDLALKEHRFEDAATIFKQACAPQTTCTLDNTVLEAGLQRGHTVNSYPLSVRITKSYNLAASSEKFYRIIEFDLSNQGTMPLTEIWLRPMGDESAKTCLAQSRLSLSQDAALTLAPGQSAKAYCRQAPLSTNYRVIDLVFGP